MPTIITHAIVPLTLAALAGRRRIPPRLALAGAALAMVPDLDTIGLHFGVPYASIWGHRGAAHSLVFGAGVATVVAAMIPGWRRLGTWLFLFASIASHGLLDTLTDGGRGVELFWPWDTARYFAPWRPIRVSPIGARFFSANGVLTLWSEARWVWLPCLAVALPAVIARRARAPRATFARSDGGGSPHR